jgi:Txe/YoeB family toxin of toxin-antitoxin system
LGYNVKIKKNARKDLPKLKSGILTSKFDELIKVIKENPFQAPPPDEKLTGSPYYSRRLNIKHRLVYSVDEESKTITILSVWSHYERGL